MTAATTDTKPTTRPPWIWRALSPAIREMYVTLYGRSGRWEEGCLDLVGTVVDEQQREGDAARANCLDVIKPIEDRSTWSEWGLVPPPDVQPPPTFAPFVCGMPEPPARGGAA
jgi:hypothetical protein